MNALTFEDTGSRVVAGTYVLGLCTHRHKWGESIGGYLKIVSDDTVRLAPLSGDIPVSDVRFFEKTDAMLDAWQSLREVAE